MGGTWRITGNFGGGGARAPQAPVATPLVREALESETKVTILAQSFPVHSKAVHDCS